MKKYKLKKHVTEKDLIECGFKVSKNRKPKMVFKHTENDYFISTHFNKKYSNHKSIFVGYYSHEGILVEELLSIFDGDLIQDLIDKEMVEIVND